VVIVSPLRIAQSFVCLSDARERRLYSCAQLALMKAIGMKASGQIVVSVLDHRSARRDRDIEDLVVRFCRAQSREERVYVALRRITFGGGGLRRSCSTRWTLPWLTRACFGEDWRVIVAMQYPGN